MEQASEVDIAIGHKVQLLRMEKKISPEDFAQSLGISLADYSQYESGQVRFSPDILLKLSQILQIKPMDIFSDLIEN